MISDTALDHIVQALELTPEDIVLEIGPGIGSLTSHLVGKAKKIIAVEKDKRFCAYLKEQYASMGVDVIQADILDFLEEGHFKVLGSAQHIKCVGNIPFQITSPLLEALSRHRFRWERVVLTVQHEVAKRLTASASTRERGPLSCWLQLQAGIELVTTFNRTAFYPAPKVDSSLVRIKFFEKMPFPKRHAETIRKCIRFAFQKRRKNILNALAMSPLNLSKESLIPCLKQAGVDPLTRPQDLALESWVRVGACLHDIMADQ